MKKKNKNHLFDQDTMHKINLIKKYIYLQLIFYVELREREREWTHLNKLLLFLTMY